MQNDKILGRLSTRLPTFAWQERPILALIILHCLKSCMPKLVFSLPRKRLATFVESLPIFYHLHQSHKFAGNFSMV